MSEKEEGHARAAQPQQGTGHRGRRRRFRDPAVVFQLLPGHRDARGSHPRLRPESPAVRHRTPGSQGQSADRHELLHGQAAPDGAEHDDPAARGDLRLDRARRPPPGRRASPTAIPSRAASAPRASSSNRLRRSPSPVVTRLGCVSRPQSGGYSGAPRHAEAGPASGALLRRHPFLTTMPSIPPPRSAPPSGSPYPSQPDRPLPHSGMRSRPAVGSTGYADGPITSVARDFPACRSLADRRRGFDRF